MSSMEFGKHPSLNLNCVSNSPPLISKMSSALKGFRAIQVNQPAELRVVERARLQVAEITAIIRENQEAGLLRALGSGKCDCMSTENRIGAKDCTRFADRRICPPGIRGCVCAELNQPFYSQPRAALYDSGKLGFGLLETEDLGVGEFVLEFVGELMGDRHKRLREQIDDISHGYPVELSRTVVSSYIDPKLFGNEGGFMNHSCQPNCEFQQFASEGRARMGIITIDLKKTKLYRRMNV